MDGQEINRIDQPESAQSAPSLGTGAYVKQHRSLFLALVVGLAVWCGIDVQRRARVLPDYPKKHRTDVTVFTTAGAAFFDDRDPYAVTNPRGWHYLYPPLFALFMAPLHLLPTQGQAIAWFVLSVAMGFGAFFEARRIVDFLRSARGSGSQPSTPIPHWMFPVAFLAVLLPTLNCLQRGQVGVTILYFMLLGFRLVLTGSTARSWVFGGIVLALPVTLKLTPLLAVGFLMLQQAVVHLAASEGRRQVPRALAPSLGVLFGLVAFVFLIPASLVGWNANLVHLDHWMRRVVVNRDVGEANSFNLKSMRNQSLSNALYRFGNWSAHVFGDGPDDRFVGEDSKKVRVFPMDHPAVPLALDGGRAALLLLLFACSVGALRGGSALDQTTAFGLACAATLLVSPLSWGHHYTALFPASLLVPWWLWSRGLRKRSLIMAVVPGALSFLHYAFLDVTGRVGLLGIGTLLWFLMACFFILRYHAKTAKAASKANCPRRNQQVGPVLTGRAGYAAPAVTWMSTKGARDAGR